MRAFLAGTVVGAAIGAAVTFVCVRDARHDAPADSPSNAPERTSPRPAGDVVATSRRPRSAEATTTTQAEEVVVPSAAPAQAPAPKPGACDVEAASFDELLAVLDRFVTQRDLPPGCSIQSITQAIARRFPGHRYPVDFVRRIAARNDADFEPLLAAAMAGWSGDAVVAEVKSCFDEGQPVAGYVLGLSGGERGIRLGTDFVRSLLRSPDSEIRIQAVRLSKHAAEVDVAGICAIAARDPDPSARNSSLFAIRELVELERVWSEDVAATLLAALEDPQEDVRYAAAGALVAAGPLGAEAALEVLARDRDVDEAERLIEAAVAAGRTGNVLDLRLGPELNRFVARWLTEWSETRPQLLRDARSRHAEIIASFSSSNESEIAGEFFAALLRVGESPSVVAAASGRDVPTDTRGYALLALVNHEASWQEGHDLARRIAADRTESPRIRTLALERLGDSGSEQRNAGIEASNRAFLTELLRDEKPGRVRSRLEEMLR